MKKRILFVVLMLICLFQVNVITVEADNQTGDESTPTTTDIIWTNKGEFPYLTGITIRDHNGNDSSVSAFNPNDGIAIRYEFAIPNNAVIEAGDTFIIPIQANIFQLLGNIEETQLGDYTIAKYEVNNNAITIRFYEGLGNLSNVSGYIGLNCWFNSEFINNTQNTQVPFVIDNHTFNVEIYREEIENAETASVTKRASVLNSNQIEWTITVAPNKSNATLAGIKVVDTWDKTLHDYIPETMKVDGRTISDSNITITNSGFEYVFPEGTTPGNKTITYRTRFTNEFIYGVYENNSNVLQNKVETYMPNNTKSSEATAEARINKNGGIKQATSFDRATDVITWKITVNRNKFSLNDVKVTDNFKGGEIITSSIRINGRETTNYTLDGNSLTFNLGNINDQVEITFQKKITDWTVFDTSDTNFNITNEAVVTSGDEFLEKFSGNYGGVHGASDIDLSKSGRIQISNDKGHYITWTVRMNNNTSSNYQIFNEPIVFSDKLTEGLTPISPLRFTVYFTDGTNQRMDIPLTDCYDETTRKYNYTFTPGVTTINGRTIETTSWYVFEFDTLIDKYENAVIDNKVNVTVGTKEKEATGKVDNSISRDAAIRKVGGYNYEYDFYQWTIAYNENKWYIFKNPEIVDQLPAGHVPYEDFVTIVSDNNAYNAVVQFGQTVNGYTVTYDAENNKIIIKYNGYNREKLYIYLKTKYVGSEPATNTATLTADNLKDSLTTTATVTYNSVPTIEKKTNYSQGEVIPWTVGFSTNGTDLRNLKLVDELPVGLDLDMNSVKLYNTKRNSSSGNLEKTDEITFDVAAVHYDPTTGTFEFVVPSDLDGTKSYILEFNTYIKDRTIENVSNTITFYGTELTEVTTSNEVKIKVTSSESGIVGEVGSVRILKLGKYTNTPLEGVEFRLLNSNKQVIESAGWVTTDANGIAMFKDCLRLDNIYYIQEVRTIGGYAFDDTMYEVIVTAATEDKVLTITLYNEPITSATVIKVWDDARDQDAKRPASLTVILSNGQTVTLNAANGWTATIEGLPVYTSDGQEITYTWTEVNLPEGYTLTNRSVSGTITTLTNTHTPEKTSATVIKVWNDAGDQDRKRPASLTVTLSNGQAVTLNAANGWTATINDLPKYAGGVEIVYTWTEGTLPEGYTLTGTATNGTITTLTNSYTPEKTSVTVKKVWNDAENQDGKRPASLIVILSNGQTVTLNAANGWTATINDLPKYANGQLITYTWTEGTLPEGYTLTDTATNGTITTLTNSYTPEKTSVTVKKVWNDAGNQDGKRPASLTITLLNGNTPVGSVTLNAENSWMGTIDNLPKYADGQLITYTWNETDLPQGYTLTDTTTVGYVTTLTNTHTPELTDVTVIKVWNDDDDRDGIRPESLTVALSNGTSVTLNATNGWTATIKDLPKYADGQLITYTWTEGTLPEGYTLTGTATDGYITTLTNTHTPELTDVTVIKVWDDAENQDGKRPASLTITLLNGNTSVGSVTLDETNGWTATIKDLPVYAGGVEIVYTWVETDLPQGYTLTGTTTDGYITTLTNTHTPELTDVTVIKVWDDADDQDGKRPASLTVTLSNGTSVTLNEANGWTATIKDLPKYADGQLITYTWTEGTLPEGYTLTGTTIVGYVTTLTNTHTPEVTDVTVIKVWDDADDQDGIRPESLTITLLNGNTPVGSVTLDETNGWTATIRDLPVYAGGVEIVYTWQEAELPEGYTLTGTATDGYITTLTNTHTPEVTDVIVIKVWDDADDQDGKRPESLTVTLSNGDTIVGSVTLNATNGWTATIKDLPVYAGGVEIVYTWTEGTLPEGYELTSTEVEGYITTITNTHTPELTDVTVTKVWDDADNQKGLRPESIVITLLANGKEYETVTITEEDNWEYTFTDLPVYDDGQKIEYTVSEGVVPAAYKVVYEGNIEDGFIVYNILPPTRNPQTGDNIILYVITLLTSILGLVSGTYFTKKYNI